MIARLARFYGGGLDEWWHRSPREIRESIGEANRLKAEECLEAVTVYAIGSGAMKKARTHSVIAGWKKLASAGDRHSSRREMKDNLAAMGIGFQRVKPKAKG